MGLMMPHVIIVGGGFGGLSAARALRSSAVQVTLVDKRNYHLFRPMLYQVATGLLSDDEISGPLRSILSHQENVDVLLDEVTGISPNQHSVHLKHRDLAYDFLILATGIRYNYFGHDEWRTFAPGLESLDDADVIRSKILLAFERAEAIASTPKALEEVAIEKVRRLLTFVLVGAGTVGVEMAGTLAEMSRMALAHDFRHIDPRTARILLYEAAPRVLPTYPEVLSFKAHAYIERFNGRLRDECLNANWFTSLSDARRKVETWRLDYNQQRPHSSLDYLPPAEFARKAAGILTAHLTYGARA